LKREFLEETSINIVIFKFLNEFTGEYKWVQRIHNLYLCNYISGDPKASNFEINSLKDDPEYIKFEPKWIDISDVQSLKLQPDVMEDFVKTYLSSKR
jgi:hypothetical protein